MLIRLNKLQKERLLESPKDIYDIIRNVLRREDKLGRSREHFWVIGIYDDFLISYLELIAFGVEKKTETKIPDIFERVFYKKIQFIALIHSHSNKTIKITEEDRLVTGKIIQAAKILKKRVVDSIVVSEKEFISFDQNGFLEEIEKESKNYFISENEKKEIEKMAHIKGYDAGKMEGLKLGEEKGLYLGQKKTKEEIVRVGFERGYPISEIMKLTGYSRKKINEMKNY